MKFKDYINEAEFIDSKANIKETLVKIDPKIKGVVSIIVQNFGGVRQDEPGTYKSLKKAIEKWMKEYFK